MTRPFVHCIARATGVATVVAMALAAVSAPTHAQSTSPSYSADSAAVMGVVQRLFDGMRTRDTVAMRAAFDANATLRSIAPNGTVRAIPIDAWITSVASAPAADILDERLGAPSVRVDGGLATILVPYWFYVGSRFSHCGMDAFLLGNAGNGWRILAVADTRRQEGCSQEE